MNNIDNVICFFILLPFLHRPAFPKLEFVAFCIHVFRLSSEFLFYFFGNLFYFMLPFSR